MIKEFRDFALKGNLLELAVAFVLGVAFSAVVTSLVDDVIMNLIAAIFGSPDFSDLTLAIGDAEIRYGAFLTALVSFLIIAFALFAIVRLANRAMPPGEATTRACPHCLTAIPVAATACSACTRDVDPQPA
ncbi:large conductance mechanosensitive channel protein MscL [Thermoleophilia bacterium SCSIO 60948]|nr:large conductance mechanosensitive channel protein MscL [Thermoleophilia bacterium SCSIO 60948]